ncbi:MAG: phosphoribosylformylglycinamidine cyclo-ligase [Candidatus Omnitrophica bacterium]|nr:phosphoribosylformylglycinamidine cyclo-ligase [Candidatus Omnitrophota bacterium]MBU3933142.1 phosphoribosylformylglycinamidine cyclo-ligase [Candidatus Omnitrophota bacterium]
MRTRRSITYKKAGVDVEEAEAFVRRIKRLVKSTRRPGWLGNIGSFGGFFELSKRYKNPVLVSSSDGVGTKLKLAFLAGIHDTVGIDLVAMNVDDCLCSGAEPLFFLDYIATGKLEKKKLVEVVKGIAAGCRQANCALIGGETAEMPDFYQEGEYDLSGFCVAVVEKKRIIDGSKIKLGDKVIGLASSGLHSNGFSLVRKIFSQRELKKRAREFLTPTRIYAKPVLSLLRNTQYACLPARQAIRNTIKGIAHITGGAFIDKIPRIIPQGLSAQLFKNSWPIPDTFREIKQRANLPPREMLRTFNMGIGMVLVVTPENSAKVVKFFRQRFNLSAWEIGEIVKGNKEVLI